MNTSQLCKIGVPDACLNAAIQGIQAAAKEGAFKGAEAKRLIRAIIDAPGPTRASRAAPAATIAR